MSLQGPAKSEVSPPSPSLQNALKYARISGEGQEKQEPGEVFENFKAALEFKVRFSHLTLAIFSKVGLCKAA